MSVGMLNMALTRRQFRLYQFVVSLYRPTGIGFQSASGGNAMQDTMRDVGYEPQPAYTNVKCYFKSASEVAVPTIQGLQSEANLFTYYIFEFLAEQEIDNTWVVQLTMPGHPNDGTFFIVTDVPKITVSIGRRRVNQSEVFAKRSDKPNGIA